MGSYSTIVCDACAGMGFLMHNPSEVPNERKYSKCAPCLGVGRLYLDAPDIKGTKPTERLTSAMPASAYRTHDAGLVRLGGYAPTLGHVDPSKLRPSDVGVL